MATYILTQRRRVVTLSAVMALLVQRLLPLLAVLLPTVLAAWFTFPTTSQHLPPRSGENDIIPTTTSRSSSDLHGIAVGEGVRYALKEAY